MDLAKVKSLIEEFVDTKTVNAVLSFAQSDDNSTETINSIAAMFGYSGSFESEDEHKLVQSFKNNLNESDWTKNFSEFLTILNEAVYLMFGQQTKSGDFGEYSLRIDPGFGIFWWYVKSLPATAEWPVEKCRNAVLLGMYFLANY